MSHRFVTADPRSVGLSGRVGDVACYVAGGVATRLYRYGASSTAWCTLPPSGAHPVVTTDPRIAGRPAGVGEVVMFVTGGAGLELHKYGPGNYEWCTMAGSLPAPVGSSSMVLKGDWTWGTESGGGSDPTLTALAALDGSAGLLEQTGADAFTKRAIGVGAVGSIPTRADADSRYSAAAHNHDATYSLLGHTHAGASPPAGVFSDLQVSVLQAPFTLAAASGVQSAFPAAQDVFTLVANSTYRVTGRYLIATGATTHTTAMAWALGGATVASFEYLANLWSAAANTISTAQSSCHVTGVASKVLNATSTAVRTVIEFDGILATGTGGTITPQINFSANPTGTNQMLRGSYVTFESLGADTVTKLGGWA